MKNAQNLKTPKYFSNRSLHSFIVYYMTDTNESKIRRENHHGECIYNRSVDWYAQGPVFDQQYHKGKKNNDEEEILNTWKS